MEKSFLHIITPNVPDRYSYNGAADMYWKIIAFQKAGINCIVHIINRPSAIPDSIRAHSSRIYFYERAKGHATISLQSPVSANRLFNKTLLHRLLEDQHPLLFDGIHSCYYLTNPSISERLHFIQLHTAPSQNALNKYINDSFSDKLANRIESIIYARFHKKVCKNAWLISHPFENQFHGKGSNLNKHLNLAPFIGLPISKNGSGTGNYCLLHGDFKNRETSYFAIWLLDTIFGEIDIPLVVAGKYPSNELETAAHRELHTCMVADPSESELIELISKSQLCIHFAQHEQMPDQAMVLSLQYGRHLLKIKEESITGGKESNEELRNQIKMIFTTPFSDHDLETREKDLHMLAQDTDAVNKIKAIIDGYYQ